MEFNYDALNDMENDTYTTGFILKLENISEIDIDNLVTGSEIEQWGKHEVRSLLHDRYSFKIIEIGDSATGKTAIKVRFTDDYFKKDLRTTLGVDFGSKEVNYEYKNVQDLLYTGTYEFSARINVWDAAGQAYYDKIRGIFYRDAKGGMLVYDANNPVSFKNLHKWLEELRIHISTNIPVMLLGNKNDLERQVPREEAVSFAVKNGLMFAECSAKTGHGVEEAFRKLAIEVYKREEGLT
jgi:Ras-related protein Rab-11A